MSFDGRVAESSRVPHKGEGMTCLRRKWNEKDGNRCCRRREEIQELVGQESELGGSQRLKRI
jgi:hypothetical protein